MKLSSSLALGLMWLCRVMADPLEADIIDRKDAELVERDPNFGVMDTNQLFKRDPPADNPQQATVPILWQYVGCYTNVASDKLPTIRAYSNATNATTLTIESCALACGKYTYFGLGLTSTSTGCSCGQQINSGAVPIGSLTGIGSSTGCSLACAGNSTQACGGTNLLSIYMKIYPTITTSLPKTVTQGPLFTGTPTAGQTINKVAYVGCYANNNANNQLVGTDPIAQRNFFDDGTNKLTVERCITFCSNRLLPLAGIQGQTCYCAGGLQPRTEGNVYAASFCDINCGGNTAEKCGGNYFPPQTPYGGLSLFNATNIASPYRTKYPVVSGKTHYYQGCFGGAYDALTGYATSSQAMTIEQCISICAAQGYTYSGLKRETCQCGNSLNSGFTRDNTDWGCSTQCYGNLRQYCGGADFTSIYL